GFTSFVRRRQPTGNPSPPAHRIPLVPAFTRVPRKRACRGRKNTAKAVGGRGVMPVALLFDLDGTLITGGGAGGRAMVRAVQAWAGSSREVFRPDMAGRTDPDIFRDLLAQLG